MPAICRKPLAWTNEKLRPCLDKLDNNSAIKKGILNAIIQFLDMYNVDEENEDHNGVPSNMSLPKFLAINALGLSVPATPQLLHNQYMCGEWMQLSGHKDTITPTSCGKVQKRIKDLTDPELLAYQAIAKEPHVCKIVPKFSGVIEQNGAHCIELENLLCGFNDPFVMDIKMGCRTFLEKEVANKTERTDLYEKMNAIDPSSLTKEEHRIKAITKLRYMQFRETLSSSQKKGFRIDALKLRGLSPVREFKTVRTSDDIEKLIAVFTSMRPSAVKEILKRLKQMRTTMEDSHYFKTHEIVGSSIFIVYDEKKTGVWLIDFAKSTALPEGQTINHRSRWEPGNREEGLLYGMDQLIESFEHVYDLIKAKKQKLSKSNKIKVQMHEHQDRSSSVGKTIQ